MLPSYWFRAVPDEKRFSSLEGDLSLDVCIIGGGIAGVSAAYFLSRAGVKVALLESGHLLTGDTAYTTAFITHFLDAGPSTTLAYPASDRAFDLYCDVLKNETIDCDFEEVPTFGFTQNDNTDDLKKKFDGFSSLDLSLEFFIGDNASKLTGFSVSAALQKSQKEAQFHVRKFFIPLAQKAQNAGVQIFEESEVMEIRYGQQDGQQGDSSGDQVDGLIQLVTEKGSVTCKKLIIAAGPPPRQFFPLAHAPLTGAITFVLEVKFSSAMPFSRGLFWDDLDPFHYFRWVDDHTAIFGGEDRLMKGPRPATAPHVALEEFVRKNFSSVSFEVTNRWQGTIFYTSDYLPYIGPHPQYPKNVFFATGFGGNGMTFGFLSAEILTDLILGRHNQFAKLFSFQRI